MKQLNFAVGNCVPTTWLWPTLSTQNVNLAYHATTYGYNLGLIKSHDTQAYTVA